MWFVVGHVVRGWVLTTNHMLWACGSWLGFFFARRSTVRESRYAPIHHANVIPH